MEPSDLGPTTSPADVPSPDLQVHPAVATGAVVRPGRFYAWALSASLVAALTSWVGGESIQGMFEAPVVSAGGLSEPEEVSAANRLSMIKAHSAGGAAAFGILGAALGLALGLAGGLARREPRAALSAGAIGSILGGGAGAVAAMGLVRVYFQSQDRQSDNLLLPLLIHGGIWSAIGMASGLAFGIGAAGRGRVLPTSLGALLGSIIAAIVFEVVGAIAFPTAKTQNPVSEEGASRLLALLVVSLLVAAGAVVGAQEPRPKGVRA